ncbi:MAG: oligosaccharide flippase family protein [Cytophagaceae bacterium]|nr:oligosaccharide flippase family protein [Cytophagaceae bacterium]
MITLSKNRLYKNILSMGFLQLINYSGPIIILIYLTRILSTENFGLIALSISITQYSVVLMDYGFGIYATKLVSIHFKEKNIINEILGSVLIIKVLIFMFVSLILSLFLIYIESEIYNFIFLLSLIPIFFQGLNVEWFFLGIEKMKVITINVFIGRLLIVILTLIFIKKNNQYIFFSPLSQVLANYLFFLCILFKFTKMVTG